MKNEWYYVENDNSVAGPLSIDVLRGRLAKTKSALLVWREGMPEWRNAQDIPELLNVRLETGDLRSIKKEDMKRVVLITGATSGIGKACAEHLNNTGWRVFGTGRNVTSFNLTDPTIEMIAMDVNDDISVFKAVDEVVARAGRLDAVINNAGYSLMGAVEDTSIEEAKSQFETNFFGALRVCRAALPALRKAGGGYIINISSLAGIVGLPYSGLYSANKFALEGVSESLRLEVRQFGIKVVLVEPGDFQTKTTSSRRVAAAAQSSLYKSIFEKTKQKQDKEEINGSTPEPIAKLIGRILKMKQPKMRYSVGRFDQRIVIPLKRFLPQRVFEWLFRLVMGV
jgi:NAD(P)-dependent dehydrogenase (short-subunit alcohol dehydrogenase family)